VRVKGGSGDEMNRLTMFDGLDKLESVEELSPGASTVYDVAPRGPEDAVVGFLGPVA
jgi:hypothetical protein